LQAVLAALRHYSTPVRRPIFLDDIMGVVAQFGLQFAAKRLGIDIGAAING
jgi:hypothetical protein